MKAKKSILLALVAVMAAGLILAGCGDDRRDTRKYVDTIGVVFTNDLDNVFQELYVYPGGIDEMGQDFIKNSKGNTKVGSYGVTLEVSDTYNVWLKDRNGGSYEFNGVPLVNADHAVISYDKKLYLTVQHEDGSAEVIEGHYVYPGDAPDHPQEPLKSLVSYKFNVQNETGATLALISMREEDDQRKGEVELHIKDLENEKSAGISGKLDEEDGEITDWVLHIETADGKTYTSKQPFDPWTAKDITLSLEDGELALTVSYE